MSRNPDSPAMRWSRPIILVLILLVAGLAYWLWWREEGVEEVAPAEEEDQLEPWDQPASRPVPAGAVVPAEAPVEVLKPEAIEPLLEEPRPDGAAGPAPAMEADDVLNRPGPEG